ncbi:hypothetical protein BCR35DRAFT_302458 [Leucosporidium creatinivorum]|uniref:histidine kinase n=1 Tax=Leucosporidium creatinivorum TaxID=106004 RepID=A0A1Y2FT07_9BASI|nr:hypothetical protein BCR35DRAFT_302458 [Leucosporidium creatinivorum]
MVEQLALLPFLRASRAPAAVLALAPLQSALTARQLPLETPRELQPMLRRLNVSVSSSHDDTEPTSATAVAGHDTGDYFSVMPNVSEPPHQEASSLQLAWQNKAFAEWFEEVQEGDGNRRGSHSSEDTVMEDDSPSGKPSTSKSLDLSLLPLAAQDHLISYLLDTIEMADEPLTPGVSPPTVELPFWSFSATLLPPFVILTGVAPLPAPSASTETGVARLFTSSLSSAMVTSPKLPSELTLSDDPYLAALGTTKLGRLIRDYDWSSSLLGPMKSWPAELRTMVSSILASPNRECILWGEHRVIIYNDEYVGAAGSKHPELLGKPAAVGWGEIWDGLEPIAARVMAGETVSFVDHFLPMKREGFIEETYHTFSYQPFRSSETGEVIGIRNLSMESTAAVIAARRLATVRDLVQTTSLARTVPDFADFALESISSNAYDLPFTLLYTAEPVQPKPSLREIRTGVEDRLRLGVQVTCCGSLGIPSDHPYFVQEATIDLTPPMSRQSSASGSGSTATAMADDSTSPNWSWPFEEACLRREPVVVELDSLSDSLEPRGWNDRPRCAVVIPIMVDAAQSIPQAILVLGINPRSQYDDLHATFFNLLARHIAVGLFAVMTAEIDAKRADDLVRLDKAKTSFFSSISHELRTPLTLILAPLEDVLKSKEQLQADHRQKLVLVQRHSIRLLNMVNKLLDYSSLEGGKLQVKFRPVKLGAMTRDLATLFRDAVERGGLQFIVDCDDDPPDTESMYVATDLWEKVIYNIVGNAVKYCHQGSIEVTLRSSIAEAVLSVRDTGVGIHADDLSRIFERFARVEGTARTTSGTGIGLAYTLEIVKVLGGQLEVDSEPGKGSTFVVRLPRGFTHLPIAQVVHEPEEEAVMPVPTGRSLAMVDEAESWRHDRESFSTTSSHGGEALTETSSNSGGHSSNEDFVESARLLNLSNRTVLVVEDSPDLRAYMSSILSKSYNVVQVADGQAGLDYALAHPPSLIVTDQMMPKLNGYELVAALRANPATALVPVVMVSAAAGTEVRAEALERGLDDYLCKPFQARELLARVNTHLQLGIMRIELEKRVQERTKALIDSEAQNRALADRFSTLSSVSPVGILQANEEGDIVYVNPRFFAICGHPPSRAVKDWRDAVLDADRPALDSFYDAALTTGADHAVEFESLEVRFKHRDDAWGQFDVRSFQDVGGKDAVVLCLSDLSRQKRAEILHIETVEAQRAEAEKNRMQTEQYLDLSSHELRNPLSGVWQNAELLATSLAHIAKLLADLEGGKEIERSTLTKAQKEMQENLDSVESILICASHQGRIADDILNVSKLNMGLLSVVPVPFDLQARMAEVLRMFETESNQKQITLRLSVGESIHRLGCQHIIADPSRLAQILLNFLSNSIKYTADAARRHITVHLDAYPRLPPMSPTAMRVSQPEELALDDGRLWISVGCEDSGKGLSAAELKKLFARFSQANPKSDQYGGSGLGLYVSKALVELHDGFIEVESTPGRGSVFRFLIPAAVASLTVTTPPLPSLSPLSMVPRPKRAASRPTFERRESSKNLRANGSSPVPKHILVVEDNLINQKVLTRQLKLAGYAVSVANNGREGLDLLLAEQTKQPNPSPIVVALMDIEMPVMGGIEAITLLREMESTGQIAKHYPVIAVTGNARQGQLDACIQAGFTAISTKPYVFVDLLATLKRYTGEGPLPPP